MLQGQVDRRESDDQKDAGFEDPALDDVPVQLFLLAVAITIVAWRTIDIAVLPATPRRLDRFFGWFLLVIAVFLVVGLHLPGLVDAWADQPSSSEYLADPMVFWLVKFMDLALVVPALVAVGVGVLRKAAPLEKAKYAAAGWVALLGSSVAGMAIVMQATGDPAATMANTVAFSLFAAVGLAVAVLVYRPLFSTAARQ
jgi:succinate dehydrogenase/fumarate reductase cytochrome b subunit